MCRALLGPADADDAWSETFLAALRAYPDLRPDSNVRGWLVTIAHRKAIDVLRAPRPARRAPPDTCPSRRRGGTDAPARRSTTTCAPCSTPCPRSSRRAVVYRYLADLPYVEVARLLDSTEAAARRSAADGIAALRAALERNARHERSPDHASTSPRAGGPTPAPTSPHCATRLAAAADRDGLVDVAYRDRRQPVRRRCSLAATADGVVRIAFAREGHDERARRAGRRRQPAVLRAPAGWTPWPASSTSTSPVAGAASTSPSTCAWPTGSAATVLEHLRTIGYGPTESYAEAAAGAGKPAAVRAAASACSHNPVPIVVPCHRVVRSDGSLGHYRGGADIKAALLQLEAA